MLKLRLSRDKILFKAYVVKFNKFNHNCWILLQVIILLEVMSI